ncbi:MAG TPA: hypothetical protein VFQ80_11300 [Thermomicrobiales bacterium]|nr:hypothetical protein [Thermomicrobiales bacterium]
MDGSRFDRLARLAGDSRNRRDALRMALAGAFGAGALAAHDAAAKKHKCKAKKGKKRCDGVCISIIADPNNCGDCGVQCNADQNCVDGACVGGGGGGLPIEALCTPGADVCEAGLECDSPTTRHTCSDTVANIDHWCCLPPGAACDTECDCCGDNYCENGQCKCNPEGGGCSGGPCNTDDDCGGNTPLCCGGTCVDPLSDPNNCNGCDNVCNAGETCEAGNCTGGGGGGQCAGPVGICDADGSACGQSVPPGNETCTCELAVEQTNFCADGAHPCDNVVECTSSRGGEATSCLNLPGFGLHFFCIEAKESVNFPGQFCGCGFGTQTGRVCVAECDMINPAANAAAKRHRGKAHTHRHK